MREYKQLNADERVKIALLLNEGKSLSQIATSLNRDKATISRELRRNQAPPGEYWPDTAQGKALQRRKRGCILDFDPFLKAFVLDKLCCDGWTPEQIAGFLKCRQSELEVVCHETIYAWIYSPGQKSEKLWKYLPRHKAKRGLPKSRGAGVSHIPGRVSIHDRPAIVAFKVEFGHWEGDLISCKKGTQHAFVGRECISMYTVSTPPFQ